MTALHGQRAIESLEMISRQVNSHGVSMTLSLPTFAIPLHDGNGLAELGDRVAKLRQQRRQ
jgi:hypothetical protein